MKTSLKFKKKIISIFSLVVLLLNLFPLTAFASAIEIDGTTGVGTATNPQLATNAGGFATIDLSGGVSKYVSVTGYKISGTAIAYGVFAYMKYHSTGTVTNDTITISYTINGVQGATTKTISANTGGVSKELYIDLNSDRNWTLADIRNATITATSNIVGGGDAGAFNVRKLGLSVNYILAGGINNAPVASNLSLLPAEPADANNLTGSYTYTDANNDHERLSQIRWYHNTQLAPEFNDTLTIPAASTSLDDEWYFTVRPFDGLNYGNTATSTTVYLPAAPNAAPVIDAIGNKNIAENSTLDFTVHATDSNWRDVPTYSIDTLPDGASFNTSTGAFNWTPTYDQAGDYTMTFGSSDGRGGDDSETITISVSNTNRAPVLDAVGNKSVDETNELSVQLSATDPDGDAVTYTIAGAPAGSTFDTNTGLFTFTPTYDQSGNYNVTFGTTDGTLSTSEEVTISVGNVDRPSVLDAIGDKETSENSNLTFAISATDPDGDAVTYTATNLPAGATLNEVTGVFSWTPTFDQAGNYSEIEFTATSGDALLTDSETISISVSNTNRAPALDAVGNKSIDEGGSLSVQLSATDPDGDAVSYTLNSTPAGATFNPETGLFTWTPTNDQSGNYDVTFETTDGTLSDSEEITISVGNVDRPSNLDAIGDKSVNENFNLSFTVSASDPDGDAVTLSAENLPEGATFNTETGEFSWTPSYSDAGTYGGIVFTSTSGGDVPLTDSETISITVNNVDRSPALDEIGNKSTTTTHELSFNVTASDPDGDAVTLSASNLPDGATFNTETGVFNWTPTADQAADYDTVTFSASSGEFTVDQTITITVTNDGAPIFDAIANPSISEHQEYSLVVSASDLEGDTVSYTASNLPDGAAFDTDTHTLNWTPTGIQSGTFSDVTFVAKSGTPELSTTKKITITVNNTDHAPTINELTAITRTVDATVFASVIGSDIDEGDTVTMTHTALPEGAGYDAATGNLVMFTTHPGTYSITFTAHSGTNPEQTATATQTITLTGDVPSSGGGSAFVFTGGGSTGGGSSSTNGITSNLTSSTNSSTPAVEPLVLETSTSSSTTSTPTTETVATTEGTNGANGETPTTGIGGGGTGEETSSTGSTTNQQGNNEIAAANGASSSTASNGVEGTATNGQQESGVNGSTNGNQLAANALAANTLGAGNNGSAFNTTNFLIGGGLAVIAGYGYYISRRRKNFRNNKPRG